MSLFKDRNFLFIPLLGAAVLFACKCTNAPSSITQGIYYSPAIFDPALINDMVTAQIFPNLIETLITVDVDMDSLRPNLAESWTIDESKSLFTLKIKKNILFHDGRELTSKDVSFSLLRQFDKKHAYYVPNAIQEELFKSLVEKIEITGKYEVSIQLKQPNILFPYILSSPYCSGILSDGSLDKNGRFMRLSGTGPFVYDRRDTSGNIYLHSFKGYWGESPVIKHVEFRVNRQSTIEKLALEGNVDVVHQIRGQMAEKFLENKSFEFQTMRPITTFYLGYNLKKSNLSNKTIRHNMANAIDKEEIASSLNRTNAEIAISPLPPGLYWSERYKNVEDKITLSLPGNNSLSRLVVIGYTPDSRIRFFYTAILKYFKNIGYDINEMYFNDWESYFEARERGDYDMFFSTWRSDFVGDPYFFLYSLFHSESTNNYFHYKSAEVDSLLDQAKVTESREVRDTFYQRILDVIEEDCPGVFIHHPKEVFVVNKRFAPIIIDPYGYIHFEKITTY